MVIVAAVSVDAWEIGAAVIGVLSTVLAVYGGFIKLNYDVSNSLKQRLLGDDEDETDDGFLVETQNRMDQFEEKMDSHSRETHEQLYAVDQKLNIIARNVGVGSRFSGADVDDVPPPSGRDFLRGGDHGPQPDGGTPGAYAREADEDDGEADEEDDGEDEEG